MTNSWHELRVSEDEEPEHTGFLEQCSFLVHVNQQESCENASSHLVNLGWSLSLYIPNRLLVDSNAADPWITLV